MGTRILSFALTFVLISTAVWVPLVSAQPGRDAYNRGFEAGLEDGPKDVGTLTYLMGALLGPLAIGINLLSYPHVPEGRVLRIAEEGEDFIAGYKDGYRKAFRKTAIINNFLGWSSWLIIAVIMEMYDTVGDLLENSAITYHNPTNIP